MPQARCCFLFRSACIASESTVRYQAVSGSTRTRACHPSYHMFDLFGCTSLIVVSDLLDQGLLFVTLIRRSSDDICDDEKSVMLMC